MTKKLNNSHGRNSDYHSIRRWWQLFIPECFIRSNPSATAEQWFRNSKLFLHSLPNILTVCIKNSWHTGSPRLASPSGFKELKLLSLLSKKQWRCQSNTYLTIQREFSHPDQWTSIHNIWGPDSNGRLCSLSLPCHFPLLCSLHSLAGLCLFLCFFHCRVSCLLLH